MRAGVIAAALAQGCVAPVTEVMVVIGSDLVVGVEVDAVRVVLRREGSAAPTHDVVYDLRSGRFAFPGTLGVVARDPDDRAPLEVTVTAARAGRDRLVARATGTPLADAVARLDLFLARRCLDAAPTDCAPGTVCGRAGCETVSKDPLPLFTGVAAP